MTMVDSRLNIETLSPLELQEFLFFYANLRSHSSKSGIGCFRLLLSFQSQRFLQVAFYSLKVEWIFVLIGRIVTLS